MAALNHEQKSVPGYSPLKKKNGKKGVFETESVFTN